MERYYFKFKDRLLAEIIYDGVCFHVDKVYESNKLLYMLSSDSSFNNWVRDRQTLVSRKNAIEIFRLAGVHSDKDFVDVSLCLSLQDCLWLCSDKTRLWKSVSLFSNPFNKVYTNVARCGNDFSSNVIRTPSPELTVGGSSLKWCKKLDGKILFFKSFGGMAELEYSGCYAEYFTSQLCRALGVSYVDYSLSKVNDIICSVSECFNSEDRSSIYVAGLCDDAKHLDTHMSKYSGVLSRQFRDMMMIDCLVFNVDRHDENISLMYDNEFNILGVAPMYDFDHSLFYDLSLVDRSAEYVKDGLRKYVPKTYNDHSFLDQFRLCIYPEMYNKLQWLVNNFEFKNHRVYKVSKERLRGINYIFRWNLRRLLKYGISV